MYYVSTKMIIYSEFRCKNNAYLIRKENHRGNLEVFKTPYLNDHKPCKGYTNLYDSGDIFYVKKVEYILIYASHIPYMCKDIRFLRISYAINFFFHLTIIFYNILTVYTSYIVYRQCNIFPQTSLKKIYI